METQEQPGVLREGSELLQGKEQEAAILRKELQLCPYLGERKPSQEGCMYCCPGRLFHKGESHNPRTKGLRDKALTEDMRKSLLSGPRALSSPGM